MHGRRVWNAYHWNGWVAILIFYTKFWIPTHSPDGDTKNQTRCNLPHQVHEALWLEPKRYQPDCILQYKYGVWERLLHLLEPIPVRVPGPGFLRDGEHKGILEIKRNIETSGGRYARLQARIFEALQNVERVPECKTRTLNLQTTRRCQ